MSASAEAPGLQTASAVPQAPPVPQDPIPHAAAAATHTAQVPATSQEPPPIPEQRQTPVVPASYAAAAATRTVEVPAPSQEPPPIPGQSQTPMAPMRHIKASSEVARRIKDELKYGAWSIPEFDSSVPRQKLCCFRASEYWRDAESMFNGESSYRRFALMRATRAFVYEDLPRKPLVVLVETTPDIQRSKVFTRVGISRMPPAKPTTSWADEEIMAFEAGITHILCTNDLSKVTSTDVELTAAIKSLQANQAKRKPGPFPQTKFTVELTSLKSFRDIKGGTIVPEAVLVSNLPKRRLTVKVTAGSDVAKMLTHLATQPNIQHVHTHGSQMRIVTHGPLTHPIINAIAEYFDMRVFPDDMPERSSAPPSTDGLSDTASNATSNPPRSKRYTLQSTTGSIIPPAVLNCVLARLFLQLVPSKFIDATRYFLQATKDTPALETSTRCGAKLVLEESEPRSTVDF